MAEGLNLILSNITQLACNDQVIKRFHQAAECYSGKLSLVFRGCSGAALSYISTHCQD